jgi:hypothetical protein
MIVVVGFGKALRINPVMVFFKTTSSHRASWKLFRGDLENGLFVCHSCDVRSCVNPDHLFLGTAEDNGNDRAEKLRVRNLSEISLSDRQILTIYLDAPVAHKFKARASMEGKSMTSIIRDLVASYVKPESFKGNGQI